MKKQNVKNLTLSKKVISNLMTQNITGARDATEPSRCYTASCDLMEKTTVMICVDTIAREK